MLLEVFIRKNFGERYFSFTISIINTFVLLFIPFILDSIKNTFRGGFGYGGESSGFWHVIGTNILWYLFLAAFMYFSWLRRKEIKRSRSSFDFGKFSKYSGDIDKRFKDVQITGRPATIREIETMLEPLPFFVIGFVLMLIGQSLGILLFICSIIYALSNRGAYYIGDNAMLDIIDKVIINENLKEFFVNGKESNEAAGFRSYSHRPSNPDDGQKAYEAGFDDFEEVK
ncbi:hypothetical protein BC343_14880 [Mucilaginibacter pedocola]|uniref:Uncharacterized protein n=1 Tax=Mucilaginibacter pedocola TaxID=1792845 RepID=A0A1S9P8T7_9SPHI|nr:hypothetical protein BC343_14880 [Mucilaginibacter pedocola]